MRVVYIILMLVMLLFAGVQINDPDGLWWAAIYLVPVIALAVAAFIPHRLSSTIGRVLVCVFVAALAIGTIVYWPQEANFWQKDVWWESEPVREGLGVAIAFIFTCVVLPLSFRSRKNAQAAQNNKLNKV